MIAINAADARPSRFVGGERIDTAISELDLEKRKEPNDKIFNYQW